MSKLNLDGSSPSLPPTNIINLNIYDLMNDEFAIGKVVFNNYELLTYDCLLTICKWLFYNYEMCTLDNLSDLISKTLQFILNLLDKKKKENLI